MRELRPPDPQRVAAVPSVQRLGLLGIAFVLVPGIVVFVIAKACGLGTGAAGLWGLLTMLLGMIAFPLYLRSLAKRFDRD